MNFKTNGELLIELQKLKQENAEIKALHDDIVAQIRRQVVIVEQTIKNFETFFNTINDFLFVLDQKGHIIYTNNTVTNRLGYTREQLSGNPVVMVHPPERRDEAGRMIAEILSGLTEFCHVPIMTKSGIQIPVETRVSYGFWYGKPAIFSVSKDISKAKFSEEKFSKVFYLNPSVCGLSDLDTGKYVEINDRFHTLLGFEKNEVIGKTAIDLGLLTEQTIREVMLKSDVDGKVTNVEVDLRAKNGAIKQVLLSSENIYVQDKRYKYTVVHDVTELKKTAQELIKAKEKAVESEAQFRLIFENSLDAIIWTEAKTGKIIACNPAALLFSEYTREELIGQLFTIILPPQGREEIVSDYQKHQQAKGVKSLEFKIITKSGEIKDVALSGTNIEINGQEISQGIFNDITDRKQKEQELILSKEQAEESDRLKSAFLANMSHEIRTPMNGILGFADLLKNSKLSGQEQQEYIRVIERSGHRMLNIINDIVDISKLESGQTKVNVGESDINQQIEYLYSFFKPEVEQKAMQLHFKNGLPSSESVIQTAREKVFAILTNLIKNAIKYSDRGNIEFGYEKKGLYLEFFVKDQGIGIPKLRQEAIFERFIQADIGDKRAFQGAGLGLAITKGYVEMLGGKIWVESHPGKGSTFYFTLPFKTPAKDEVESEKISPPQTPENRVRKMNILIAEDDDTSEMLISATVKTMTNRLFNVSTGIEAVKICRQNPDIELILMDIQMPEMDGYEATRQIRQFNPDIIIIAQTAFALVGDREKALAAGCTDYIAKPVNLNELIALIQKYFH